MRAHKYGARKTEYRGQVTPEWAALKFWPRVNRTDECWEWGGSRGGNGYGQVRHYGALLYTHRLSYEIANGSIPIGGMICHHCDNPPCVRPDHLFLGSQLDNVRDMWTKDRANHAVLRGEQVGTSKLTSSEVAQIRGLYSAGHATQVVLALMFGVSQSLISDVVRGKAWAHVKAA